MKLICDFVKSAFPKLLILTWIIFIPIITSAQMRGTYTIDPAGSGPRNFTTFNNAKSALGDQGVDSAVVFNVAEGDYNERIQLGPITGASAANTITFQGDETDSTKVRLWFNGISAGDQRNVIIFAGSTSYFRFRKMMLENTAISCCGNVISSANFTGRGIVIENCLLKAVQPSGVSTDYAIYYDYGDKTTTYSAGIAFRNNLFLDGSFGIYSDATSGTAETPNFEITGNQFINQNKTGIYLVDCPSATISNNDINLVNLDVLGIDLNNCDKDNSIRGNRIVLDAGGTGIRLNNCIGNVLNLGLTANNFITIEGTTSGYGIYLDGSTYQMIYHNNVNIISTDIYSCAFYGGIADHNELKNNIFSNTGGGMAYYLVDANTISSSDYNNYFANWNTLARVGEDYLQTIDDLRIANSDDAHSVSVDPGFVSSTDLHTNSYWLDGKGDPGVGIATDIDGETRSSPPDIGADEYSSTAIPLAGTYKVGGTDPDYPKVKDAFYDLQARGVLGPTTFEIRNGTYNEFIGKVYEIQGASENDTIVFRSESGNPGDVIIYFPTDITDKNIIHFYGTDHFTLMDISITAAGKEEGTAVSIEGTSSNINIINTNLSVANNVSNVLRILATTDDIVIKNNSLSKGGRGIFFYGNENNFSTNTNIEGNTFSGSHLRAIQLRYQLSPRVKNNIAEIEGYTYSFMILDCNGDLMVTGNKIINRVGYCGISLENCVASNPFSGLIANNMIQPGDSLTAWGILVKNCERQNIYHNSINITSSDSVYGRGIVIHDGNEGINLVNNIFANSGGGYAIYVKDPADISLSDYNELYTTGDTLASWGGVKYPDLSSLTAASGMDDHSLSVDPKFVSVSDLHTRQFAFMGAGTPLEEVSYDIDNHPRDPMNPDIGAMEFWCETPDFNILVSTTCVGDSTVFIDKSTNITEGASFSWDFNGNFSPELSTEIPNDTLTYYYDTAGLYTLVLIVNQLEGCEDFTTIPVPIYDLPDFEIISEGAYCDSDDGQATVHIIEGNEPFTYYWSDGSTDSIAKNLALGTYTVAVSDSIGCTSAGEVTISEKMVVTVTEIESSSCGNNNGIAEVSVTGGVEPYSYVWSDGATTEVDSFMAPGLYYVNVIDANDCYARGSVVIGNDGSGPEIILEETIDNACFGDEDGMIDIDISGGELPYDILWSNGSRNEDLENLPAGIYDVVVLDNDSCIATGSYIIQQPSMLTIGSAVENSTCLGNDGRAAVKVSGGTEPYKYNWSHGGYHPTEENLSAGIYSVTITDDNGCEEIKPVVVNSIEGPVVSLFSMTGVTCTNPLAGSIEVSTSGGTPLYTWLWSPGGYTTPKIDSLPVGIYEVKVTDSDGCEGFNFFEITEDDPPGNPICLVTVDSASGMNTIVWERLDPENVDYYVIYRESSLRGEYVVIGTSPPDSPGIFTDSVADPTIRSWKYRLSVIDKCGNESELSDHHKTMHLTMNIGLDGDINLIWDHYEGFLVETYEIWRYDSAGGWTNLDNLPSDQTSYTDKNPPRVDLTYYIETDHPSGCLIYDKKAGTLNSSKSNRQRRLKEDAGQDTTTNYLMDQVIHSFSLYPNPSSGVYNLEMELMSTDDAEIRIFDVTGKLIMNRKFNNIPSRLNTRIDLSGNAPGIYHMQLGTNRTLIHRVLIRE